METLRLVLLFLHILGFAALFGGLLVQAGDAEKRSMPRCATASARRSSPACCWWACSRPATTGVDHAKIGVKFVIGLVLLVLVMANTRKPTIPQRPLWARAGSCSSVANIAVAVFWSPAHACSRTRRPGLLGCRAVGLRTT